MMDLPCDVPYEPDKIVYMENCQVTKVLQAREVPEFYRGFWAQIPDENGRHSLQWAETAAVVTIYRDEKDRMCSPEKADIWFIRYLDKDGNIIHSPLTMIFK